MLDDKNQEVIDATPKAAEDKIKSYLKSGAKVTVKADELISDTRRVVTIEVEEKQNNSISNT